MKEEEKSKKESEYYIGVGLCLCIAFGVVFDNIGLGICLGLVSAVAMQKKYANKQELPPKK
jgi:hypothetical protein